MLTSIELEAAIAAEIDGSRRVCRAGPWEPVEDLTNDVYTQTKSAD